MAPRKPLVVVTRKLPDAIETRMMELFDTRLNADDTPLSPAELGLAMQQAEVLVPTVTDRIDAALLNEAGPGLRLIASFGTGVDHIDLAAAWGRGITVTNTPRVLTEDTADMTMALILAVSRRLAEGERLIRQGKWQGWGPTFMLGQRLGGKRLGIIGMGRIGRALARRARGFGLSIHYHNRRRVPAETEQELEATYWESLDQMLARMDILSVNCPHTPATYHLLSARRLKLMRQGAVIVNTARGEIIDETALTRMLAAGEIGGAGLDVFEHEPAVNPKLLRLHNVVLLPHMGSATLEGRIEMGEKVIINIKTFTDGHRPPDRVLEGTVSSGALPMIEAELSFRSYRGARARHRHPHHQLVLAVEGRLALEGEGGAGFVDGGQAVLVRAEAAHAFESSGRNRFLVVDVAAASGGLAAVAERGDAVRFFPVRPELHHLIRFLAMAGTAPPIAGTAAPLLVQTLMRGLEPDGDAPPVPVRAALAFLHRNYARPIGCADIAAAAGLSLSRLHPLFRDRVGATLGGYLADLRLTRARELLAAAGDTIAGIALAVGYGDQSSFTRSFRRRFGVTPARYRRRRE